MTYSIDKISLIVIHKENYKSQVLRTKKLARDTKRQSTEKKYK